MTCPGVRYRIGKVTAINECRVHQTAEILPMTKECDCGAETVGKWADKHTEGCASLQPRPMTRQEIIELICQRFEPCPSDWPRHRGWDDHAGEIADEILASFGAGPEPVFHQPPTEPDPWAVRTSLNPDLLKGECPLCKLKASTGLHRFCTRGPSECPLR